MRLRNIAGSREFIADSVYVVHEEETYKGKWNQVFGNNHPIYVEIGMGKGRFLMDRARLHPENNYVGIEKYSSVLLRAIQKQEEEQLPNVKFIRMDAELIPNVFEKGEVAKLYLNFSDPWPKERNAKRRLVSHQFLARYEKILAEDAVVEFKTDNVSLFDFGLDELNVQGWELMAMSRNLHRRADLMKENVMTEYEEKFSSQGNAICMMRVRPAR